MAKNEGAAPRRDSSRLRRIAASLLAAAAANAEGAVYGVLMVGVLLAAEDARRETYAETFAAVAIVVALYWLTRLYTYALGIRLQTREPLNRKLIWRSAVHELPVIEGAATQAMVLIVAWATGASVTTGVRVTIVATAVFIIVLELVAGWRARPRHTSMWFTALAAALIGLGLVAIKVVLHV